MALVLPSSHPSAALAVSGEAGARSDEKPLRIGIINIMPRLEAYEPLLLGPLSRVLPSIEPVFVRLESHGYLSSDHDHLDRFYTPFEIALSMRPFDGLIVTGAPVEELPFEDVHYWRELSEIITYARGNVGCTLGLCWGGLAIAKTLGVEKRAFRRKLFGVFEDRILVPTHDLFGDDASRGSFLCAHSRHSGLADDEIERAARDGSVRLLSRGERSGYTMFETPDQRLVGHIGHPEYEGERLAFEWNRDREARRSDVYPPEGFDASAPTTSWRNHREALFAAFVGRVAVSRSAA